MHKHILYSFRRCPYAIRARWSILLCNLDVEIREINLKQKPKDFLRHSSKGTVPVLITKSGVVIEESMEIIKWCIKRKKNEPELIGLNKELTKEINSLIDQNDKIFKKFLDRYKYSNRYIGLEKETEKQLARNILIEWNKLIEENTVDSRDNSWLVGSKQSLADWAIWPFVRQYKLINVDDFNGDKSLKSIRKWLDYFMMHLKYEELMSKHKFWIPNI